MLRKRVWVARRFPRGMTRAPLPRVGVHIGSALMLWRMPLTCRAIVSAAPSCCQLMVGCRFRH
eukprot:15163139-Heterocapsa_arctica.AAC.1